MSLKVLSGEALWPHEFAEKLTGLQGMKIQAHSSGKKKLGILFGTIKNLYTILVDTGGGKLLFTDIETQERVNNRHVVGKKLPLAGVNAEKIEDIRRTIALIANQQN